MNGLFSLVNYGLANADGGFGPFFNKLPPVGDMSTSVGVLTYPNRMNSTDVRSKIDALSTMLTAGRLSEENKQVLQDAHTFFNSSFGIEAADRVLLKLMASTPEFHTSNTRELLCGCYNENLIMQEFNITLFSILIPSSFTCSAQVRDRKICHTRCPQVFFPV